MEEKMEKNSKRIAYLAKSKPVLEESRYMLRSRQAVCVTEKDTVRGRDLLEEKFEFEVSYRRFKLSPEEIHSVYPPALSAGDYVNHIPQLTLMKDTLPWEQSVSVKVRPDRSAYELPGMFLLVLKKDEGAVKRSLALGDWGKETDVYIGKKLLSRCGESGKQEEFCLDVPTAVLKDILPRVEDLPFMAHVRCVGVEDKETRQFVTEGRYSSLIANRVPVREEEDVGYEVFVVSTLGLEEYYRGGQSDFEGKPAVRLSCLYSWEFTSYGRAGKDKGVFLSFINGLNINYMGNMPETAEAVKQEPGLEKLLCSGWRPFNTLLRNGSRTVAWYKSPLSPGELVSLDRNEAVYGRCLSHADAGMAFLPQWGMYDATYSAAWTLGRLLALKNQPYLTALFELRLRHQARDKAEWNLNLIRELLYEEEPEGDFDALIEPVREGCARMLREAAGMEAAGQDNREKERASVDEFINGRDRDEESGDGPEPV